LTKYDFTIIGGGPIGLYAAVIASEAGASCNVVESRFHLGGVMMAAYPEKNVLNFPGIPSIIGRDLINDLIAKARNGGVAFHIGEYIDNIQLHGKDTLHIKSSKNDYHSSVLIIAAGLKAYFSSLADFLRIENWDNSGIAENWPSLNHIENKRVALICNNDRELIIPDELIAAAREFTILAGNSKSPAKVSPTKANVIGKPWTLHSIAGKEKPETLNLVNLSTGQAQSIGIDYIIGFFDNQARQTLYGNLGIKTLGQLIEVDQKMQTSMKRVYAIGDIAWYPGKVMLLSAGIQEAKIAVKNALKLK
jgi:ferredoxin/flavodoxin---NADP+ reductase